MKKSTSRALQRGFHGIVGALKPGQLLQVTLHGKPLCTVIKAPAAKVKRPAFAANVAQDPYSAKAGARVIQAICDEPLL